MFRKLGLTETSSSIGGKGISYKRKYSIREYLFNVRFFSIATELKKFRSVYKISISVTSDIKKRIKTSAFELFLGTFRLAKRG